MEIPVLEEGKSVGALTIRREGLYTCFEALLPARAGLQRLWLCGETGAVCLGLLTPETDGLRLRRRFSRAELRDFPVPPLCASLSEPSEKRAPEPPPASPDGFRRVRIGGAVFVLFPRL